MILVQVIFGVPIPGIMVFRIEISDHSMISTHGTGRAAESGLRLAFLPAIKASVDYFAVIVLANAEGEFLRVEIRPILGFDEHASEVALLRGVDQ